MMAVKGGKRLKKKRVRTS